MALFVARIDGTTTFELVHAQLDIIDISSIDNNLDFDEANEIVRDGVTLIPVNLVRTQNGPPPERLDDLINNLTYVSPPDIIIFGVDDSFTLPGGLSLKGNGVALPLGDPDNPFTADVCCFYDVTLCGGDGVWVDKEGGGKTCNTTPAVLFHELSHCFHFVTNTLPLDSDGNVDFPQEEVNAEIDENLMRDQDGLDHRDTASHDGGCGGPCGGGCCVVASLSTGSFYSMEVEHLRYIRSLIFSESSVGDEFFKILHERYYAFSPEVCRLMAENEKMKELVRDYFVTPLIMGLELIVYYTQHRGVDSVQFLKKQYKDVHLKEKFDTNFLVRLSYLLNLRNEYQLTPDYLETLSELSQVENINLLLEYINPETIKDDYIKWALLDTLDIWLTSSIMLFSGIEDSIIDAHICNKVSEWLSQIPISNIWKNFSELKTDNELKKLEQYMFDTTTREKFATRLAAVFPQKSVIIHQWSKN